MQICRKLRVTAAAAVALLLVGQATRTLAAPITTDLHLWYDASAGTFSDTAGTTTVANGGTVGQWRDQATNAANQGGTQNATQATTTKAPTYITSNAAFNGASTLRFTSASAAATPLSILSTSAPLNSSFTIFVVASVPTSTQTSTMISNARPTSMSGGQWVYMVENGGAVFRSNGVNQATASGVTANTPFIASAWSPASGVVNVSLNGGIAAVNSSQNTSQFPTGGNIGVGGVDVGGNPARTMNGDIAEILVYNTSLSPADRQATLDYLGAKYAITVVPEPAGVGLVGAAVLAGLLGRRRRAVNA